MYTVTNNHMTQPKGLRPESQLRLDLQGQAPQGESRAIPIDEGHDSNLSTEKTVVPFNNNPQYHNNNLKKVQRNRTNKDVDQDELIKIDADNSSNRMITSKLSSGRLDQVQRGEDSEIIDQSQQTILPLRSQNETINVKISERNSRAKGRKNNTSLEKNNNQRVLSLQKKLVDKTTDMSSIVAFNTTNEFESSHHLALGKRQISSLQTQTNSFALHSRQRKLSIRYQKPVAKMRNKRRSDVGIHHRIAQHMNKEENGLNFDIIKVEPATSPQGTNQTMASSKNQQTKNKKYFPATSYVLDPSYKQSFQIIDAGCPNAQAFYHPFQSRGPKSKTPHHQIPYPAMDQAQQQPTKVIADRSSSSNNQKVSFSTTPFNIDSTPPHASIPTKTFSFQFGHEQLNNPNGNKIAQAGSGNGDEINYDVSERMMSCRVVGSGQAVGKHDDEVEVNIKIEQEGAGDTQGDDEIEGVKCEDDNGWMDQVLTIQPSLEHTLQNENQGGKKPSNSSQSKHGNMFRMNIQTMVADDKGCTNDAITFNKQDTYLSMSDIESFRQMKGLDNSNDGGMRVGTSAVSGDNILEEIAQTQEQVRQALRWKSRSGENWLATKFPSHRKIMRVNQQSNAQTAQSSHARAVFVIADTSSGQQQSTVAMTAQLPRPQSNTAGGGFSKNIVVKKIEQGQQRLMVNTSSFSAKASSLLKGPGTQQSQLASRPSTNIENNQINVTNYIQQMKYSSSLQRQSQLTKEMKQRSLQAQQQKKISEPCKQQDQNIFNGDNNNNAKDGDKKRELDDIAESQISKKKKSSPLRVSCSQSTLMGIVSKNNIQMSSHQSQLPGNVSHMFQKKAVLDSPSNDYGTQEIPEPEQIKSISQSLCQNDTAFFANQRKAFADAFRTPTNNDIMPNLTLIQQTFSGSYEGSPKNLIKSNAQPLLQMKKQQQMIKERMRNQKQIFSSANNKGIDLIATSGTGQIGAKDPKTGVTQINLDFAPLNSQWTQNENATFSKLREESTSSPTINNNLTYYIYENEQHRGAYRCHDQPRVLKVIKKMTTAGNTRNLLRSASNDSPQATQTQPTAINAIPDQPLETANSMYQTVDQSLTNPTLQPSPSPTTPTLYRGMLKTIDDLPASLRRGDSPPFAATKGASQVPSYQQPTCSTAGKQSKMTGLGGTKAVTKPFILNNFPTRKSQACETAKKEQEEGDGSLRTMEVGHSQDPGDKSAKDPTRFYQQDMKQLIQNGDLHDELSSFPANQDLKGLDTSDRLQGSREKKRYWTRVRDKKNEANEKLSKLRLQQKEHQETAQIYSRKNDERMNQQRQLNMRITELFRKKQPVIKSSKDCPFDDFHDPGMQLAAGLSQENAFYLKRSSTTNLKSNLMGKRKELSQKSKQSQSRSKQVSRHASQLRQIRALGNLAKVNNIKLQKNQGMSFEALQELRREAYLMSPQIDRVTHQYAALPSFHRNVKFIEDEVTKDSPLSADNQNPNSTFNKTANGTFQNMDSLRNLFSDTTTMPGQGHGGPSRAITISNIAKNPLSSMTLSPSSSPMKPMSSKGYRNQQTQGLLKASKTSQVSPSHSSLGLAEHNQYLQDLRSYYAHTQPAFAAARPQTSSQPPTIEELAVLASKMHETPETRFRAQFAAQLSRTAEFINQKQDDVNLTSMVQKMVVERRFGMPSSDARQTTRKVQVFEVM